MYNNGTLKKVRSPHKGFTLLECTLYLALISCVTLMVCHVALIYHHLYDTTAGRADSSVMTLVTFCAINEAFDQAIMHKKSNAEFFPGTFLKKDTLMVSLKNNTSVLLEKVTHFRVEYDYQRDTHDIEGVIFDLQHHDGTITWYRAVKSKAFSCSYSL